MIDGLALAPYKVIRATQDVDLLTDTLSAQDIDGELVRLGYRCICRSDEASTYRRQDERVDFLFAHRPISRKLLAKAARLTTPFGDLRVVSVEGLIGFKLQAMVNNPRCTQDLVDIQSLISANRATLDWNEVREYFRLFDREALLEELMRDQRCPESFCARW